VSTRARTLQELVSAALAKTSGDPLQALLTTALASGPSPVLPPAPVGLAPGVAQALDVAALAAIQEQIVHGLARLVRVGNHAAEIQLDPPELGKVRLRLEVRDRVVTGSIEVEKASVLTALQAGMHSLVGALEKAGIRCDHMDVQLLDPRREQERRDSPRPGNEDRDEPGDELDSGAPAPAPRARAGHGLVDYWL
jgi:flagellar hook-length control protein FliK